MRSREGHLRNRAIGFESVRSKKRTPQPMYAVNEVWREAIRAKLEERRMSMTDLAKAVGISHSMVSQLLDDTSKARSSKHVPKIHEALGLPPPQEAQAMTPLQFKWMQLYAQLDEDAVRNLIAIGERMPRRKD